MSAWDEEAQDWVDPDHGRADDDPDFGDGDTDTEEDRAFAARIEGDDAADAKLREAMATQDGLTVSVPVEPPTLDEVLAQVSEALRTNDREKALAILREDARRREIPEDSVDLDAGVQLGYIESTRGAEEEEPGVYVLLQTECYAETYHEAGPAEVDEIVGIFATHHLAMMAAFDRKLLLLKQDPETNVAMPYYSLDKSGHELWDEFSAVLRITNHKVVGA